MPNGLNEETKYSVTSRCPQCGREHITVFKLRHISDEMMDRLVSLKLGDFFRYEVHDDLVGARCLNSAQHPDWGPR